MGHPGKTILEPCRENNYMLDLAGKSQRGDYMELFTGMDGNVMHIE